MEGRSQVYTLLPIRSRNFYRSRYRGDKQWLGAPQPRVVRALNLAFWIFEIGYHYVAQDGLKPTILWPQPLAVITGCRDHKVTIFLVVKKMGKLVMKRRLNKAPRGLRADLAPVQSSQQQALQRKGSKEVGPLSPLSSPPV